LGLTLASLIPEKAADIEARAADYAYSREICGAHYRSDTEASHTLAVALVTALLLKPELATKVDAARMELRAAGLTRR
jgi:acid phosphatase (class A)